MSTSQDDKGQQLSTPGPGDMAPQSLPDGPQEKADRLDAVTGDRALGNGAISGRGLPKWNSETLPFWPVAASIQEAAKHCLALPRSVLISSFFINLLGLALPLVILQLLDRVLPNKSLDTLTLLAIGLVAVVFLESILKIARSNVMSWAALKQGYANEVDAVNRILRSRGLEFKRDNEASWIDRLDALGELNNFYGGPARLILLDLPFVVIFFAVIGLVGGPLLLVPLVVIGCFTGYTVYNGRHLKNLLEKRSEQDGRRYDFVVECLKGITAIKSMAMEPSMQRRFERLQGTSAEISYDMIRHNNTMQTVGNLFANVSMVAMVTVGALAIMSGQLSIGALACCSLLSGRVVQPVLRGIAVLSELQNVGNCHKRAEKLFDLPEGDFEEKFPQDVKGGIRVKQVVLNRDDGKGRVFDNLNLDVEAGQIIGIRGADGSGRTRFLNAIRGEHALDGGSIHIDGINVSGPAFSTVEKSICYVSADAPMFRGSVIDNITMFRRGKYLEAARAAARLIGLEADIHALPEGYDTLVGEGVANVLSGGMQQRIAIARVLVRTPKILLFDEANRAVDFVSDQTLRAGLASLKGEMTILLVSNRPSLLEISDAVYEMENGTLSPVDARGRPIEVSTMSAVETDVPKGVSA